MAGITKDARINKRINIIQQQAQIMSIDNLFRMISKDDSDLRSCVQTIYRAVLDLKHIMNIYS
jgi:hypothetical protein